MQSRLGSEWAKIGDLLGVRVIAPFQCELAAGGVVVADALLCLFGGPIGTVIVSEWSRIASHGDALNAADYGYSVLTPPVEGKEIDLDVIKSVLDEWGWYGEKPDAPDWYAGEF